MSPPAEPLDQHREMSITHADLFRLLPAAVARRPYSVNGSTIVVRLGEGKVEIDFSAERERRIASLALPVTHLSFRFHGVDSQTATRFMAHFERSFQRGGG